MENMTLTPEQASLVDAIQRKLKGCRFASFTYSPKTGGTFRYTLLLGTNYRRQVENSLNALQEMGGIQHVDPETFKLAKTELLNSFRETLETGKNHQNRRRGTYVPLGAGIKLGQDNTMEISGLVQSRIVITPSPTTPRPPKSDKAKAKAAIRRTLPLSKYRNFCLDIGCMRTAKLMGDTINIH